MTSPASSDSDVILRLVWPQWQGAGSSSVRELAPDFDFEVIRRGYVVGTAVLEAVLPAAGGPTETVSVPLDASGLASRGGVEAKDAVLAQLDDALRLIAQHDPARILTLGGDCAVSVAPFSALAGRYGDDLAIVWIDSHPDVGTPASEYDGYHAMAVAALTGHGDPDVLQRLPATVEGSRVALVGGAFLDRRRLPPHRRLGADDVQPRPAAHHQRTPLALAGGHRLLQGRAALRCGHGGCHRGAVRARLRRRRADQCRIPARCRGRQRSHRRRRHHDRRVHPPVRSSGSSNYSPASLSSHQPDPRTPRACAGACCERRAPAPVVQHASAHGPPAAGSASHRPDLTAVSGAWLEASPCALRRP